MLPSDPSVSDADIYWVCDETFFSGGKVKNVILTLTAACSRSLDG